MNIRMLSGILLALLFVGGFIGHPPNTILYVIAGGPLFLLPAFLLLWSGMRARKKVPVDTSKAPTGKPANEIGMTGRAISVWNPPALDLPEEYERRCLTAEFLEETEERTFRSDTAFADVLAALNSKRLNDTIRLGTELLPRFRDLDLLWEWVSVAHQEGGQLDNASQVAKEGLRQVKRKSVLLARLGDIEWQRGNLPDAVYALSQALHCYADRPMDYNPYLLLSYVAEGVGLANVAAGFLRQVDRLRAGTVRLPTAQANRLLELSRRTKAPVITRLLEGLALRYLTATEAAGGAEYGAELETAGKLQEKPLTVGELFDAAMRDAHRKLNAEDCQQLSSALVAICTSGFKAAEIQKALSHPIPDVRRECAAFINAILREENR